jgi:integrase
LLYTTSKCRFDGFLVVEKSRHVASIKRAWNVAREAAGLDERVTPYSLRHTAARWMRQQRASEWDVATQLGHKRPGTTETYIAFHPDYLKDAAKALDKLVRATAHTAEVRRYSE